MCDVQNKKSAILRGSSTSAANKTVHDQCTSGSCSGTTALTKFNDVARSQRVYVYTFSVLALNFGKTGINNLL